MTVVGLGTLTFRVSSRVPAARSGFVRGVLLLHLFEYPAAAQAFREAERLDPSFAMAYWGEAMTHTHPVWNEQDVDAGRRALERLAPTPAERAAQAATTRERGYLGAVELLYGDGSKAHRDTLYAAAMQTLARAYPADDEARLFFALSLLGLSEGVRNVPTYLRAAAIAESVLARNPQHPGAAHYLIHAVDDPDHAARGLGAARALAQVAAAADHAQHMTSHIFMALGMWEDVVRANERATRLVDDRQRRRARDPVACGHYNVWLDYGYLQLGRIADATGLLERCRAEAARAPRAAQHPRTRTPIPLSRCGRTTCSPRAAGPIVWRSGRSTLARASGRGSSPRLPEGSERRAGGTASPPAPHSTSSERRRERPNAGLRNRAIRARTIRNCSARAAGRARGADRACGGGYGADTGAAR